MTDRFITLLTKELSGEISEQERREFLDFLEDDTCASLYRLYKLYWSKDDVQDIDNYALFERVKLKIKKLEAAESGTPRIVPLRARIYNNLHWQNIAVAVVALLCLAGFYYYMSPIGSVAPVDWEVKSTIRGERTLFVLPDGTSITLNAESNLRFPSRFSGKEREVYLSGEAFFDVKQDPKHPFVIHTEKMNVRVLGTSFNVKAYPNDPCTETALIQGSVEVTLKDSPNDKVILKPSEKLIVNYNPSAAFSNVVKPGSAARKVASNAQTQITYIQRQDTTVVETSWVQDKLIFQDESFADICRDMERWYNVDIRFSETHLKELRFSATFEEETVEEALKALQVTEPFHYKKEGNTIYIY